MAQVVLDLPQQDERFDMGRIALEQRFQRVPRFAIASGDGELACRGVFVRPIHFISPRSSPPAPCKIQSVLSVLFERLFEKPGLFLDLLPHVGILAILPSFLRALLRIFSHFSLSEPPPLEGASDGLFTSKRDFSDFPLVRSRALTSMTPFKL